MIKMIKMIKLIRSSFNAAVDSKSINNSVKYLTYYDIASTIIKASVLHTPDLLMKLSSAIDSLKNDFLDLGETFFSLPRWPK